MSEPYPPGSVIKIEESIPSYTTPLQTSTAVFKCEFCDEKYKIHRFLIRHQAESHKVPMVNVKSEASSSSSTVTSSSQGQHSIISPPSAVGPNFGRFAAYLSSGSSEEHFECALFNKACKTESGLAQNTHQ
eukprot:380677_1